MSCTEILKLVIDVLGGLEKIAVMDTPPIGAIAEFDVNDLLLCDKTIMGIVEGSGALKKFIPELVALYQQAKFLFYRLIKFYRPEEINQAALDSECGLTLKPIIRIA